jgi:hypothetical protein
MLQTASRKTQAVFKISSYGKGQHKIAVHLSYISRRGKLELEDQDGNKLLSLQEQKQILKSWSPDFGDNPRSRDTMHLVLSMPPGSDREKTLDAARKFLKKEYKDSSHEYMFVAHNDTDHPHVHVVIKMVSRYGNKLNPRKAYLHQVRKEYASICRSHGIDVEASSRVERGLAGQSQRSEFAQMKKCKRTPQANINLVEKVKAEQQLRNILDHPSQEKMIKSNQIIRKRYSDKAMELAHMSHKAKDMTEQRKYYRASRLFNKYAQSFPMETTRGEKVCQQLAAKLYVSSNRSTKMKQDASDEYQAVTNGERNEKGVYKSLTSLLAKKIAEDIVGQVYTKRRRDKGAELELELDY